MKRTLDLVIINAIKSIIEISPESINYDVTKETETKGIINSAPKFKVTRINIIIKEPIL